MPAQEPMTLADILAQAAAVADPQAAAIRRRVAVQIPYGPVAVPFRQGLPPTTWELEAAMQPAQRMPEQHPYVRDPRNRVPSPEPYIPRALDALAGLVYGLQFGRGQR